MVSEQQLCTLYIHTHMVTCTKKRKESFRGNLCSLCSTASALGIEMQLKVGTPFERYVTNMVCLHYYVRYAPSMIRKGCIHTDVKVQAHTVALSLIFFFFWKLIL